MRIIWNLFKLIIALALVIPLGIFALAATVGIVGILLALAVAAFKLACIALLAVGAYKLAKVLFFGSAPAPAKRPPSLPAADPYYEEALRELDDDMGVVRRR